MSPRYGGKNGMMKAQRFNKTIGAALAALLLSGSAFAEEFSARVDRIMNNPCLNRARVCVVARNLKTGKTVYEKNPDLLLTPASNMKIITSAAALTALSPWYKFDTIFSYTGERRGAELQGDLVVTGRGDPHLVSEELWIIANEVRDRGIARIKGDIVLDDGYFDGEPFPAGWRLSSIRRAFEAPLGALSLNFNTATVKIYADPETDGRPRVALEPETPYFKVVNNLVTAARGRKFVAIRMKPRGDGGETMEVIGKVKPGVGELVYYRSVADPIRYFGETFRLMLKKTGVEVDGNIVHGAPSRATKKLFVHSSMPLLEQVADMNKYSNNFMAEQVLKTMGAEKVSTPGTEAKGISVMENVMESWGISPSRFHFVDGSGLGKENRLTCSVLTDVLGHLYTDWKAGPEFMSSLAVMGKDGSVRKRNIGNSDVVRVKTGTLDGTSALSGYFPLKGGEMLAFSIIFNDLSCHNSMAQHIQNRLLIEMESLNGSGE